MFAFLELFINSWQHWKYIPQYLHEYFVPPPQIFKEASVHLYLQNDTLIVWLGQVEGKKWSMQFAFLLSKIDHSISPWILVPWAPSFKGAISQSVPSKWHLDFESEPSGRGRTNIWFALGDPETNRYKHLSAPAYPSTPTHNNSLKLRIINLLNHSFQ